MFYRGFTGHSAHDKKDHFKDTHGFRAQLAINLLAERRRNGLSVTVLERFLDNEPEEAIKKIDGKYEINPEWRGKSDRTGVLTAEGKAYLYGEEPEPSRSIR